MAYTSGLLKHRVTILNRMRKSTPNAGVLFSYLIAEEVMLRWTSFTMSLDSCLAILRSAIMRGYHLR